MTEDTNSATMSATTEPDPAQRYNALIDTARAATSSGRHADAARAYHDAMLIVEEIFGAEHPMVAALADALMQAALNARDYALSEQAQRRLLAYTTNRLGEDHIETALVMNNLACDLREQGKLEEAERLMRRALAIDERHRAPDDPKLPHRMNNLATVLILRGGRDRLAEAAALTARAWGLKEGRHDITSARILYNRLRLALLIGSDPDYYIGQFKTLLASPSLGNAGNVTLKWDCDSLIAWIEQQRSIARDVRDMLTALVRVLNGEAAVESLERFDSWRNVEPIPLSKHWPDLVRTR